MEILANWLLQGSVVVVAAAALLRLLRRARAHTRYWVCVVGFSLVLALPLISPLAAFVWRADAAGGLAAASPALVSLPHAQSSHSLIFAVWFVWIAAHGALLATAAVRIARIRRRVGAFPNAVAGRLWHWTQVKERGRRTRLVLSDDVAAAAVIGVGTPVIAVAPALVEHLTADELDRVVIHEWAHVQRRDDLANAVQLVARLLAGWHPALWWFDRRLQAEREAACDETAVHMTGSSKGYAACLLKLASLPLAPRQTAPVLGVLSSTTLSARIQRIVAHGHQGSPAWSRNVASAGIIVLLGVCCGIGSLRIVGAAILPSEPELPRVMAMPPPTPPPLRESPPVASAESAPAPREARRPSRKAPATLDADVRTVIVPPGDLSTDHVVADALPDSGRVEPIDPLASQPDELLPARSIQLSTVQRVSPWAAAANAGIALGERSKKGGLATAGFFTRLGKRVADSF